MLTAIIAALVTLPVAFTAGFWLSEWFHEKREQEARTQRMLRAVFAQIDDDRALRITRAGPKRQRFAMQ